LKWANLKKTMAVVLVAALVLGAFAILTVPNAKAQNLTDLKVLSYSYYIANQTSVNPTANVGDVVIVGEVQNVGSGVIGNGTTVGGTALDANGTTLASSMGLVFAYEMKPSDKAPFYIDLGSGSWVSSLSTVSVQVTQVVYATTPLYVGLTIPNDAVSDLENDGNFTVVGTIQNNGTQSVHVWAVVTFYNAAGTVVAMNFTDYLFPDPIQPTGVTRFVAEPMDNTAQLSSEISSYAYVLDALPVGSQTQTTSTPTPPSGSSSSPTQIPLLPIIVVVVIVVVAAAALLMLRNRQKAALPPPPPPPPEP